MTTSGVDQRSAERRALDERIAAEPPLPPPDLPPGATASPVEAHLARTRRPLAVALVAGVMAPGIVLWSGWLSSASRRLPDIQAEMLEIIHDGAAVEGGVGPAFAMRVPVPTLISRPAIGMNDGDLYANPGVRWLVADETYVPAWADDHPEAWGARQTIRCWPWGDDGSECLIRVP